MTSMLNMETWKLWAQLPFRLDGKFKWLRGVLAPDGCRASQWDYHGESRCSNQTCIVLYRIYYIYISILYNVYNRTMYILLAFHIGTFRISGVHTHALKYSHSFKHLPSFLSILTGSMVWNLLVSLTHAQIIIHLIPQLCSRYLWYPSSCWFCAEDCAQHRLLISTLKTMLWELPEFKLEVEERTTISLDVFDARSVREM